jgi:glycosyltransferase involved in cell wall biosynthesis
MLNNRDSGPLVSIGVPVYNGDKYLYECLESIHKQTYQHWECFVINNQSTDNSPLIAKSFEELDSRFRVITNPDFVSMTVNFNNTIKPVSKEAKYFKVVCADDWLFPEYLTRMVEVMEKYPEAGFCSSYRIDNKTVNCFGLDYYQGPRFQGNKVLLDQLMYKYDVTGSETTVMYRIETLKKIKNYPVIFSDNSYHFDTELAYELLNMSDLAFVFQVLSYTRRHEQAFTTKISNRFYTSLNLRENELFKYKAGNSMLEKEYRKVRTQYGYFLFKRCLARDKPCLEWHSKHLPSDRRFNLGESLMIVIISLINKARNLFNRLLTKDQRLQSSVFYQVLFFRGYYYRLNMASLH